MAEIAAETTEMLFVCVTVHQVSRELPSTGLWFINWILETISLLYMQLMT